MSAPEHHRTTNREGRVMLCCWVCAELCQELDLAWAQQGLRPNSRTQKGMESMVNSFFANDSAEER
jgi:hypothetical protein